MATLKEIILTSFELAGVAAFICCVMTWAVIIRGAI